MGELECLMAVRCLSYHLETALGKERRERVPGQGVVVHEKNSLSHRLLSSAGGSLPIRAT